MNTNILQSYIIYYILLPCGAYYTLYIIYYIYLTTSAGAGGAKAARNRDGRGPPERQPSS